MIDFYRSLRSILKLEEVHTDNNVFKLHYRVTVLLLLSFTILLTSKQYFGDPINCDVDERKDVIDTFCWISGTFIIKNNVFDNFLPGLGTPDVKHLGDSFNKQVYYQWVCLTFGIQAMFFYLPKYFWKTWEGGRLKLLIGDLGGPLSANWNSASRDTLIKYLLSEKYSHNIYTIRYCLCEVLNFINVIVQIYFMDWFVSGNFSLYGIEHASNKLVNPMNTVFPKIAKCTYFRFGPSGTLEIRDALCILPLNVLNEKFFLILWYWLLVLLIVTMLCLVYRGMFLFIPNFRVYLLRAHSRKLERKKAEFIVSKISFGDFFVLYKVGKNVNTMIYKELIGGIYDQLIITKGSHKVFAQDEV
nr:innexin inx2-like [Leptinotarsa decemlineata]